MFDKLKQNISKHQLKYGALLAYFQRGLGILIALLYTPYMIRMLGKNEYGLYSTVSSTISMLTILNLGLNAGYIRYFAKYKTNNDNESIYRLNGLYLLIFLIIGFVAFICGLGMSFNLDLIFSKGLTSEEYDIAKVLALLVTFNLAVSFPASVFSTIISAHEKFVFLKTLAMIRNALTPAIMLPILYYGYKSITMVMVSVILSLLVDISYYVYCRKVLMAKFCFNNFEKGILKSLFAYTFFIALNSVIDQINWQIDKVLLGRFKGTASVAVYSVGYSLFHFYMMSSVAVSGVFTPRIHKIINQYKDDKEKCFSELNSLFVKIGRIQFLILALVASGVVIFGRPFLYFWVGKGYEDSYYVALLLIITGSISLIQTLGIEIQRAQNNHQFRSIAYLIMAFINLAISIFLCQLYGAIGSALGTAISIIIANGFIMNIYYHKKCGINVIVFWKNIIRMSFGLILPIGISFLLSNYFNYYSKTGFVGGVLIYTLVYCISMWFVSMNEYEKSLIPVLSKFSKLKRN